MYTNLSYVVHISIQPIKLTLLRLSLLMFLSKVVSAALTMIKVLFLDFHICVWNKIKQSNFICLVSSNLSLTTFHRYTCVGNYLTTRHISLLGYQNKWIIQQILIFWRRIYAKKYGNYNQERVRMKSQILVLIAVFSITIENK